MWNFRESPKGEVRRISIPRTTAMVKSIDPGEIINWMPEVSLNITGLQPIPLFFRTL
jgi:hypothetical protein